MDFLKLVAIIICLVTIQSCSSTKSYIFWVSGVNTQCVESTVNEDCLTLYKGESLENAKWKSFKYDIQDFEFEEGVMKKIEVTKEKGEEESAPPTYKYVKTLETKTDHRAKLHGNWLLNLLNEKPVDKLIELPTLEVDIYLRKVNGYGGCNTFSGAVILVTNNALIMGNLLSTLMLCEEEENVEDEYLELLEKVTTYKVKENELDLYDDSGNKVLSFLRNYAAEINRKLENNWEAIRINGLPVNTEEVLPQMNLSLTNMRVTGNDGCNQYNGSITNITNAQLNFGAISSTKKACPTMQYANAFLPLLQKVVSYNFNGNNLILTDAIGKEVLAFKLSD